ncbi:MAG: hypothetical protein M0R30_06485 [Methanoregula sp.]|jgi:hypothetical protein|uniref:hypothetical protein n=1 Tax=Methanoregula sp. TaxID=2052170 RepID=UPI0025D5BE6E|nr:hypothetical protein [Methanoregula sp.]MCK9631275.1 hypothetical protein [Methanoregula sp.]
MSRGPKSRRAYRASIPVAEIREKVQMAENGPERLYDFTIVSTVPVAFICVKYARRILVSLAEIAAEFSEDIQKLRLITHDTAISRELWLCSKHGTLRFFRIIADGLVELGRDGKVLAG